MLPGIHVSTPWNSVLWERGNCLLWVQIGCEKENKPISQRRKEAREKNVCTAHCGTCESNLGPLVALQESGSFVQLWII